MQDNISIREWQKMFRSGAFNSQDKYTQCAAGWYDWFCQDHALAGRLKKIGRVVMGITDPFILDNYYVMYVYCPEDAGVPIPEPGTQIKNYLKRRELER